MNSCQYSTSITAIACFLIENCDPEELDLLGCALTQLADTLFTMLAFNEKCNKASINDETAVSENQ